MKTIIRKKDANNSTIFITRGGEQAVIDYFDDDDNTFRVIHKKNTDNRYYVDQYGYCNFDEDDNEDDDDEVFFHRETPNDIVGRIKRTPLKEDLL